MPKQKRFVIDGHNLIPKIHGIALSDMDDENQLIEILNEFSRLSRTQVDAFFDGAPNLTAGGKKTGLVRTHFILKGLSADEAIIEYVKNRQKPDFPIIVVSSDHWVQGAVKNYGAAVMSSESFAVEIQKVFTSPKATQEQKEKQLTPGELAMWLHEFESKQNGQNNS